jgi:hypothetical protein
MNTAAASPNDALQMRDWMTKSDEWLSPQAAVVSTDATIKIANVVGSDTLYNQTIVPGRAVVEILQDWLNHGST